MRCGMPLACRLGLKCLCVWLGSRLALTRVWVHAMGHTCSRSLVVCHVRWYAVPHYPHTHHTHTHTHPITPLTTLIIIP